MSRYKDTRASSKVITSSNVDDQAVTRVSIYCRLSLDAAGDGLGVERQERECRELAQKEGWEIAGVYVDNSISATTGKRRPDFERLLTDKPEAILTWHFDRLARKVEDLLRVIKLDVPVYTVEKKGQPYDLSTPAGRAVSTTLTAWATYEGEQKSERQKSSHRQRAKQGRPFWAHRRPFGFTEYGDHHEAEAEALRTCYTMLREGSTFAACATWLTDQGHSTTRGQRWDGSRLSRTMRHPRNAGLIVYGNEIKGAGQWDPIVSEEEWRAILARSETMPRAKGDPRGGKRVKSLLGGLAHCAECGEAVRRTRQQSKRKDGETVHTYIYQPRCHHVSINAEWLDEHVTAKLLRHMSSPARAIADGPEVSNEQAEKAAGEAVALRERLEDVARRESRDEITERQAQVLTDGLRERLDAAEAVAITYYSSSPLDRAHSPAELVAAWKSGDLSLQHRREAVAKYVASVTVRPRLNRNERANKDMVKVAMRR